MTHSFWIFQVHHIPSLLYTNCPVGKIQAHMRPRVWFCQGTPRALNPALQCHVTVLIFLLPSLLLHLPFPTCPRHPSEWHPQSKERRKGWNSNEWSSSSADSLLAVRPNTGQVWNKSCSTRTLSLLCTACVLVSVCYCMYVWRPCASSYVNMFKHISIAIYRATVPAYVWLDPTEHCRFLFLSSPTVSDRFESNLITLDKI